MKQEQRNKIMKVLELRKLQIEQINKLTLPLRDNIRIGKEVLKGISNIEKFIKHCEQCNKYLNK